MRIEGRGSKGLAQSKNLAHPISNQTFVRLMVIMIRSGVTTPRKWVSADFLTAYKTFSSNKLPFPGSQSSGPVQGRFKTRTSSRGEPATRIVTESGRMVMQRTVRLVPARCTLACSFKLKLWSLMTATGCFAFQKTALRTSEVGAPAGRGVGVEKGRAEGAGGAWISILWTLPGSSVLSASSAP